MLLTPTNVAIIHRTIAEHTTSSSVVDSVCDSSAIATGNPKKLRAARINGVSPKCIRFICMAYNPAYSASLVADDTARLLLFVQFGFEHEIEPADG
jgi:hypothetical protein